MFPKFPLNSTIAIDGGEFLILDYAMLRMEGAHYQCDIVGGGTIHSEHGDFAGGGFWLAQDWLEEIGTLVVG